MSHWVPAKEWEGQDAYSIGGGSSLANFDFSKLRGRNCIGCNDAFHLGLDIVKVCAFGDHSWFHKNFSELEQFKGKVVTNAPHLLDYNTVSWLLRMKRQKHGIADGDSLAWNYSTGAMAINLAISMGASRIFLLGYDLCFNKDGISHWHSYVNRPTTTHAYNRFLEGFRKLAAELPRYPNVRVINVTDGTSLLDCFPCATFDDIFPERQPYWIPRPRTRIYEHH